MKSEWKNTDIWKAKVKGDGHQHERQTRIPELVPGNSPSEEVKGHWTPINGLWAQGYTIQLYNTRLLSVVFSYGWIK